MTYPNFGADKQYISLRLKVPSTEVIWYSPLPAPPCLSTSSSSKPARDYTPP